ncbi:MAG: hypothetical protein ACJAZO_004265 [Myxococcota bacterium]|jgi:uncharacterized protein (DUF427 family)
MAQATFNGTVIANSDATVVVDGNHYFPADSLDMQYFTSTDHTTVCGWKGTANYYTVSVDGKTAENAGWYYKVPKSKAAEIAGHVAFWRGVTVQS